MNDWQPILSVYASSHADFNHVNWATVMSKLGRLRPPQVPALKRDATYASLISSLTAKMTASNSLSVFGRPREVANIVHALGKLRQPVKPILELVDANAEWLVSNATPQEIANVAWAFATLKHPAPSLISRIEAAPEVFVASAKPQEISNLAWAFATLNAPAPNLFSLVDRDASSSLVATGKPQEIANTAWAFATLNIPAPTLMAHIDASATSFVANAKAVDVSNVTWACATLDNPVPSLFKAVDVNSPLLFKHSSEQAISNTAWACAHFRYDATLFFSTVDSRSESLVCEGTSQAISNVMSAFAELNMPQESFLVHLERNSAKFLSRAKAQEVVNVCWALVTLDLAEQHGALLRKCWARAIEIWDADRGLNLMDLRQLIHVELHAKVSDFDLLVPVPPALREKMRKAANKDPKPISTNFNREISKALTELGFQHGREIPVFEKQIGKKMLRVDIACSKTQVAVECDGPHHFLSSGRETGRTAAKRRLLELMGWRVVNISYKDNTMLDSPKFVEANKKFGDRKELRRLYLRKKLEKIGVFLEPIV
jgi:very-short-patch-repair endonuclease